MNIIIMESFKELAKKVQNDFPAFLENSKNECFRLEYRKEFDKPFILSYFGGVEIASSDNPQLIYEVIKAIANAKQ